MMNQENRKAGKKYPLHFSCFPIFLISFSSPRLCASAVYFRIFLLLATFAPASAHPVAQGAMDILVNDDGINIQARVANEEAFVAEAFASGKSQPANLAEMWKKHGEYLLAHIHVSADDTPLTDQLVRITPPENS